MKNISAAFLLATVLLAGTVTAANAQIYVDLGGDRNWSTYSSPYYSNFSRTRSSYSYGTPYMNDNNFGYYSGWNNGYGNRHHHRGSLINVDLF